MKAKIFQRNIISKSELISYDLVNTFDDTEIELSSQTIRIKTKKAKHISTELLTVSTIHSLKHI